jgi:threonine dehydratase
VRRRLARALRAAGWLGGAAVCIIPPAMDPPAMDVSNRAQVDAARRRLRGQLVATPLVSGLQLPGFAVPSDLRVKVEVLQPSGSIYFRGALHYLLRQLGAPLGLAAWGAERPVLAAARAAALLRLPCAAFPVGEPSAPVRALLDLLGCDVQPRPDAAQARAAAEHARASQGFQVMPGADHADYAAGLATAGAELAETLPAATEAVVVAPAELAPALAMGLAAGGMPLRVQGVDVGAAPPLDALGPAVRVGLRVEVGRPSLAALHWALERGGSHCVVLSC